ncbi:MAG: hypothetical protein AAF525_06565 [Pseudomonadota bacterium]
MPPDHIIDIYRRVYAFRYAYAQNSPLFSWCAQVLNISTTTRLDHH